MVTYIPAKGDIVWLDFDPQSGREIMKTRPSLVLSERKFNIASGLIVVMPISSKSKNNKFEVKFKCPDVVGVILSYQFHSFDWQSRRAKKIGEVSRLVLEECIDKFLTIIQ